MSQDELIKGRAWVEDTITGLLAERDISVDSPMRWVPDLDREIYLLEASIRGNTKFWKFTFESLEDCLVDRTVQKEIVKSLRMYFIPESVDRAKDSTPTTNVAPESPPVVDGAIFKSSPTALNAVYATGNPNDREFARLAIEEARKSISEDGRVHPKVGAVVVKDGRVIASAHRGEIPQCHAEFIALEKKLPHIALSGATVYTTLEPCTTRSHPKLPCATRLAERRVARVVIGMLDPDDRISGRGQRALRKSGIITELFPHDLMSEVEELNRDFVRDRETTSRLNEVAITAAPTPMLAQRADKRPSLVFIFGAPLGDNDSATWVMMLKHYGPGPAHNCDIGFYDDDRKNIEHQWLVAHPNTPFPPDGLVGKSQEHIHIAEVEPEGASGKFNWTPLDPDRQHYTVSITCRDGVFVEKWEVTRVNGILRSRITIEHGPQWIEKNPGIDPLLFKIEDPEFIAAPLAVEVPNPSPGKTVHSGWKPNHRFEVPVAIVDPNGNVQVMSGVKQPDGTIRTDFGSWNILTEHFGDEPYGI